MRKIRVYSSVGVINQFKCPHYYYYFIFLFPLLYECRWCFFHLSGCISHFPLHCIAARARSRESMRSLSFVSLRGGRNFDFSLVIYNFHLFFFFFRLLLARHCDDVVLVFFLCWKEENLLNFLLEIIFLSNIFWSSSTLSFPAAVGPSDTGATNGTFLKFILFLTGLLGKLNRIRPLSLSGTSKRRRKKDQGKRLKCVRPQFF